MTTAKRLWMSKLHEKDFAWWRFTGGVAIYPYQLTFGVSFRYWPCIGLPSIRVHFLCFKFWIGVLTGKKQESGS